MAAIVDSYAGYFRAGGEPARAALPLEYGRRYAAPGQKQGGVETGGTAAEDDDLLHLPGRPEPRAPDFAGRSLQPGVDGLAW